MSNNFTASLNHINVVPTAKEILVSRTFPGHNYHFPGQSIQNLKVINQEMCRKAYI